MQQHSITSDQARHVFTPGTPVVVFDAWGANPRRAKVVTWLGQMIISDRENGVRLAADYKRVWLGDCLFAPTEGVRK